MLLEDKLGNTQKTLGEVIEDLKILGVSRASMIYLQPGRTEPIHNMLDVKVKDRQDVKEI